MAQWLQRFAELADITLFEIGGTPVTLATIGMVVLIVAATFAVSWGIRRAAEAGFERRGVTAKGTVAAVSRLIHYAVLFVGLGMALQTAGVDLSTLFAAGAVFAVGIGFAMQTIVQNFVSGVILLVERAIKPGDVLAIDGRIVRVREMGIRSTIVQSRDGEELIVPNSVIVQGTVVNFTLHDSTFRVRMQVGVTYGSDMRLVKKTLEEVAQDVADRWGQGPKEVQVLLVEFGDNSVVWEIAIWMNDPWLERPAIGEIHEHVWWALKERGIVIAFPQLDLHLDPPVEAGLARLAAGA